MLLYRKKYTGFLFDGTQIEHFFSKFPTISVRNFWKTDNKWHYVGLVIIDFRVTLNKTVKKRIWRLPPHLFYRAPIKMVFFDYNNILSLSMDKLKYPVTHTNLMSP